MYAIPITKYPIVPTSFRGVTPRAPFYRNARARMGIGLLMPHIMLFIHVKTGRKPTGCRGGQESGNM